VFDRAVNFVGVLHDIDNLSDHEPIIMQLQLEVEYFNITAVNRAPRASWEKADESDVGNYRFVLSNLLKIISPPVGVLLCHNMNRRDKSHHLA
jgi:hypothetical protein